MKEENHPRHPHELSNIAVLPPVAVERPNKLALERNSMSQTAQLILLRLILSNGIDRILTDTAS